MRKIILLVLLLTVNVYAFSATVIVTNTNDSGPGSLRQAMVSISNGDHIKFDPSLIAGGSVTLNLLTQISCHKNYKLSGLYNSTDTLYITGNRIVSDMSSVTNKTVTLDSCVFVNKTIQALIFAEGANLNIEECVFRNCSSATGGALSVSCFTNITSPIVTITNSSFQNCNSTSQRGGAFYFRSQQNATISVSNSSFISNTAVIEGGAFFAECLFNGGTLMIQVDKSTFYGNTAGVGGAISGSSMSTNGNCQFEVLNSTFLNNSGGGHFINSSHNTSSTIPSTITVGSSLIYGTGNMFNFSGSSPLAILSEGYNVFGTLNVSGNISSDQINATSLQINASAPGLNGGYGKTCYLNPGSIAINQGDPFNMSNAQNGPIMEGVRDAGSCESTPLATHLNFDGTNDQVIGNALNTGNAEFTLDVLVNYTGSTDLNSTIVYNGEPNLNGYGILLNTSTNEISVQINNEIQATSFFITPMDWVRLTVTYNSGQVKLYADGVEEFSGTFGALNSPATSLFLGTSDYVASNSFGGSIDELRIWNRALCLSEILNNINCEIPSTSNGLMGNYHFNSGLDAQNNSSFTFVEDFSGSNNNLILDNFALNGSTSNWIKGSPITSGDSCSVFQNVSSSMTYSQNVSCYGEYDGELGIVASGGIAPYTYDWNPGVGNTDTIVGLGAGNYELTVTDINGCTSTISNYLITEPDSLNGNAYQNSIPCFGDSTSISVAVIGGATPYNYLWNTGATTNTESNVLAGNYTCTVTDDNGCQKVYPVSVIQYDTINNTVQVNGIELTVVTTAGASYQWVDCATNLSISGETNPVFTPTVNGQYAVVITSNNGCVETSDCISVNGVGLDENTTNFTLSIYPNPANELLTVNFDSPISIIQVISITGQKQDVIYNSFDDHIEINISRLSNGFYLLSYIKDGKTFTLKFQKN